MADHSAPVADRRESTASVAIVGHGLLATAVAEALGAGTAERIRVHGGGDLTDLTADLEAAPESHLVITATDGWDCGIYPRIQDQCLAYRRSWLPVRVELGRAVIGPLYTPGVPGCDTCAELRRSLADDHADARRFVRDRYPRLADEPSAWLTALTVRTVAALIVDEVRAAGSRTGRTGGALLYVDLETLAVSTHKFLPDPFCPVCGALPADSAEQARIVLQPRPKRTVDTYRVRTLGEADLAWLRETYVDEQTGLIRRVDSFAGGGLAVGAAAMRTRWQDRAELSWGRTSRYRTSEIVAVLEALERHGGMAPGGRRPVVRASFAEVRDTAVDPRVLGLHAPGQYDRPGFHFQPFDTGRVCRWIWGYSFARREPILVPLAYAHYRAHALDRDDPSFAFEISNGCALGGCLEEAILYGILEVVERDAFLMTWYTRWAASAIDLSSANDRSLPMLAEAIQGQTGYRVTVFDTTMEHGVPSVWAMAVSPPGPDQPALACSAGAHLDPEAATTGALRELGPILTDLIERYPEIAERGRAMVADDSLVASMDDHSVLYSSREAFHRLEFLTTSGPTRTFAGIRSGHATADAFRNTDLTDDLAEVVRRLDRHGLDVIVVDTTTPEHRAGGFNCVKVIVPGLLPMTFGHNNRRIYGLPRLFDVPRFLAHRDLQPRDLNPHPHPFP